MSLVKFRVCPPGVGFVWVRLSKVSAILTLWPMAGEGSPHLHPLPGSDLSLEPVGSRVVVGSFGLDLAISAEDLAAKVAEVLEVGIEDLSEFSQAAEGSH
jgi:hypothetical protein